MSLAEWEAKGWLRKCRSDREEILELLKIAEADLMDAHRDMPPGWVFSLACTSALTLCTALLYGSGYRADKDLHKKAVRALPAILGPTREKDSAYLETCLRLRKNKCADDECTINQRQADSLLKFTEDFYLEVIDWLRSSNPPMVANSDVSFLKQREDKLVLL